MAAYYNDNDPRAAQWLRNLIARGVIAAGEVDDRSIEDVKADDLQGFDQCHFFAGIGGWQYALRIAGWPDNEPVWTGSVPCQPLSSAGQRKGHADKRHLWPAFYHLISECRPATIFGEQVASKDGLEWFAGVRADLEDDRYAIVASNLCAAGVKAPHGRQRIYWVAYAHSERRDRKPIRLQPGQSLQACLETAGRGAASELGNTVRDGTGPKARDGHQAQGAIVGATGGEASRAGAQSRLAGPYDWNGPTVIVPCSDGSRRISAEPLAFPLANGIPNYVGRVRGYGNAIVPELGAEFITASVDAIMSSLQQG